MTLLSSHEELMQRGLLCSFTEEMGHALFVSHQWVSYHHPDPDGKQFQVLQKALENLVSGTSRVILRPTEEMYFGRMKCPTAEDFKSQAIYIWYDYFSVPQGRDSRATDNRQMAIGCIASYCARSYFFVILCHAMPHAEQQTILTHKTWSDRGWCRLERMARALGREDGFVFRVEDTSTPTLCGRTILALHKAPGRGMFAYPDDKRWIAPVMVRLVRHKLQYYLHIKDMHRYRFLMSVQHHYLDGLDVQLVENLIPGFRSRIHPQVDPFGFRTAQYLHQMAFYKVTQIDLAGWTPLCYAAVKGDLDVVKSLLYSRADCQDAVKKGDVQKFLAPQLPVLSVAAGYQSNEVMELLLSSGANVNARDGFRGTALSLACLSNNWQGVRILFDAKIDPNIKALPGLHPFTVAACASSIQCMQEMCRHIPMDLKGSEGSDWSVKSCLFVAILNHLDAETTSYLIEASADINQQFSIPMREPLWWLFFNLQRGRHLSSPSSLTRLCYHHKRATPLMFCILAGQFEAAAVLLKAGARVDLRNARGKTAVDLLEDINDVPERLNMMLRDASDSDDFFSI